MMSGRTWIVGGVIVVAAVAAFWFAGDAGRSPAPSERSESAVKATPVRPEALPRPPAAISKPPETTPPPQPPVATLPATQAFASGTAPSGPAKPDTPLPVDAAAAAAPRRGPDPVSPAKAEADAVALNIRHYSQRFGGNPVGSNAEIVKELMGGNSAKATYLPSDLQHLNEQGELIDPWGTPYFFHQQSADKMEVRSAGPDKKMWTVDDVTAR